MELFLLRGYDRHSPTMQTMQPRELAQKIIDSPEDIVFILATKEFDEFMKLHQGIMKREKVSRTKPSWERELSLILDEGEINHSFLGIIPLMGCHPDIGGHYKIGCLTPLALGSPLFAVFYTKPVEASKRAEVIQEAITAYMKAQSKQPPLS